MLIPLKSSKNNTSSSLHARLEELEAEAEAALDAGDPRRAADLYREAVTLAPLDRNLRMALGDALLAVAESTPRKRSASRSRVVETLDEEELQEDSPPVRRPRAKSNPGMAATDEARANDEREHSRRSGHRALGGLFGDAPSAAPAAEAKAPRRRPSTRPAPARKAAPLRPVAPAVGADHASPRRPRGRFLLAAALYAGISLVVLGAAQGMISHVLRGQADLPEVPTVEMLPDELTSALNDATSALAQADPRRAIEILEGVKTDHPAHKDLISSALARAWRSAGNRELDRREYARAAEAFETATRLDPLNADNWIELGRSFREHGRSVQARDRTEGERLLSRAWDAYRRALDVSRDDPAALVGIAQTLSFMGQRNDAVEHYERVIRLHGDSPEASLARQHLSQLTGRS